jgi:thioredoxin-like negative regulator of GroEL
MNWNWLWLLLIPIALFFIWRAQRSTPLPRLDQAELQSLAARGQIDEIVIRLQRHLARRPGDPALWLALAESLVAAGRSNDAIEALRTGHSHVKDTRLLAMEAYVHREHARLGPGRQVNSPHWDLEAFRKVEDKDVWQRTELKQALSLLTEASELEPTSSAHRLALAEVLDDLQWPEQSAPHWKELASDPELQPAGALGYARALTATGELELARKVLAGVKPQAEHTAEFWNAMATLEQEASSPEIARSHRHRAELYAYAPDFVRLRFTEDLHATLQDIQATLPGDEEGVYVHDVARRKPALQGLLDDPSDQASELLAAVCYHHTEHGEFETHAIERLADRGDRGRELVLQLLAEAPSLCTRRAAAAALAERGDTLALPTLIQLLPADDNLLWRMEIALALAKIGDDRAIEPLIETLAPDWCSSEEEREGERSTADLAFALQHNPRVARWNAAIALGYFDNDPARNALRRGLKNPEIELPCRVALYRLDRDKDLLTNMDAHPELQDLAIIAELDRIDDAVSQALLHAARKRLQESRSGQESED